MTPKQRQQLAEALHKLLQGGSAAEEGARELFEAFWPEFVRQGRRAGLVDAVAEELASDALHKMLQAAASLRDPVALESWARRIASNTINTHFRDDQERQFKESAYDEDDLDLLADVTGDPATGDPTTWLCLKGQIEKFCQEHPLRSRMLEQCALNGWSIAELSRDIQRTEAATREYLSQCRKYLRSYLEPCLD